MSQNSKAWGLLNTTVSTQEEAELLIEAVLQTYCVACIHLSNIASVYRWDGQLQREAEILLSMKIPVEKFSLVKDCISRVHPYEIPEILLLPILSMSDAYADWLRQQIS